jgi:flavin-dependent dehydrogenase
VRNEDAETPDPESTLYVKHLDGAGISWCNLNDRNEVDVLIGRIDTLTGEDKDKCLEALYKSHPILTDQVLKEGKWVDIGLRCTAGGMVADGYALVGDSAFMTMPFMGSGIEASMKAGLWLGEHIISTNPDKFDAKDLWGYQVKYFEQLGAVYTLVDVVKRWALNINPDEINWLFGCGAVTNEDMALLSTDTENPVKLTLGDILKKVGILLKNGHLIGQAIKWVLKGVGAMNVAKKLPKKYNIKKVQKWQNKYDNIIVKIERGK